MAKLTNKETKKDDLRTVLVMQMGQFIDHDFAHSPNFQEPTNCCDWAAVNTIGYKEKCFPIPIPANDTYFSPEKQCMDFHRAISTPNLNCELGKREQVIKTLVFQGPKDWLSMKIPKIQD